MCPEEDGGCGSPGGGAAAAASSAGSGGPEETATTTTTAAGATAATTGPLSELRSWWEVPAIAHFCSLFRTAFRLPDFEIEVSVAVAAAAAMDSKLEGPPVGLSRDGATRPAPWRRRDGTITRARSVRCAGLRGGERRPSFSLGRSVRGGGGGRRGCRWFPPKRRSPPCEVLEGVRRPPPPAASLAGPSFSSPPGLPCQANMSRGFCVCGGYSPKRSLGHWWVIGQAGLGGGGVRLEAEQWQATLLRVCSGFGIF